jgi:hypothetical protein
LDANGNTLVINQLDRTVNNLSDISHLWAMNHCTEVALIGVYIYEYSHIPKSEKCFGSSLLD